MGKIIHNRIAQQRGLNEEIYQKMIEEIQDYAIVLLDEKGYILKWNKGAEKIKGYKEDEILGKSFKIFYRDEDQAIGLPEKLLNEAAENGRAYHEGWRVRKDGVKFWGSVAITALHQEDGEIVGFSKVTRDLTEKKMAEDRLKEVVEQLAKRNEELIASEQRYHKMISEVQDYAILMLNEKGDVENWNSGAEFIKGYRASEILGKNFRIFYTEEDKLDGLPEKLLNEAKRNGKAAHEGWRVRKNGTRFWGSISITAFHDNNGKVIGYSKVTRDLTARKIADDKLKIYTKELESQNKELEQFAYVASHDLQEPLRKIQTFVEVIQRKPGDTNHVAKYFEKIRISANRMSELIRSVLNFSKLSRIEEVDTIIDLNEVLDQVKTDFEILIQEKKAEIKSEHLPSVIAVQEQMIQLFTNLIANALKFTDKETPVIDILSNVVYKDQIFNAPESLLDTKYAEIIVRDNGIGFDQQFSSKIFEMFQRLHGRNEFSGTGIGLALCKKIVENHKGYITVHSEVGKGASFYIYLPLRNESSMS